MKVINNYWKKMFVNRADKRTMEIAVNMVKEGWSPVLIQSITGLPLHQIQVLKFKYT